MKKNMILCAGVCVALALTSCGKGSESAYRKAYLKAQEAQQTAQQIDDAAQNVQEVVTTPVVTTTPVTATPATQTTVVDNYDNVSVRQEQVLLVSGSGLKSYSVVVGAFGLRSNAEGLQQTLKNNGYDAQIVKNEERGLFRVIASTFDSKSDAARSRDELRGKYPDAWLLYNK